MPDLLHAPAAVAARLTRPVPAAPSPGPRPHRVSVETFHAIRDAGLFPQDGPRLELIDGEILEMPLPGPRHAAAVDRVMDVLIDCLPPGWRVRVQNPTTFTTSETAPDLAVVPRREGGWGDRHPGPADCAVLVEVADSSLAFDRDVKGPVYAGAGVGTYWIVNLRDGRVEVHDEPHPGTPGDADDPPRYRRRDVDPGGTIAFHCGGERVEVETSALLS